MRGVSGTTRGREEEEEVRGARGREHVGTSANGSRWAAAGVGDGAVSQHGGHVLPTHGQWQDSVRVARGGGGEGSGQGEWHHPQAAPPFRTAPVDGPYAVEPEWRRGPSSARPAATHPAPSHPTPPLSQEQAQAVAAAAEANPFSKQAHKQPHMGPKTFVNRIEVGRVELKARAIMPGCVTA